ncbi:hypothetical protein L596_021963 [Steinernema carpocapsae]|uniref:Uncharacterized protein n=1 Tax=Steinernema carpocapsae TaxID=34508 RepID=A0A4U5MKC4_STECR|nr:hypothetical protein L596_021963 [Steinernema carpocapsae]
MIPKEFQHLKPLVPECENGNRASCKALTEIGLTELLKIEFEKMEEAAAVSLKFFDCGTVMFGIAPTAGVSDRTPDLYVTSPQW